MAANGQRRPPPPVALPRIPSWKPPTAEAKAKAAEAQRKREEASKAVADAKKSISDDVSDTTEASALKAPVDSGKTPPVAAVNGESGANSYTNGFHKPAESAVSVDKLRTLVGSKATITNSLNKSFTGTVYSCDSEVLVLSTGVTEYHLIPIRKIKNYESSPEIEPSEKRPNSGKDGKTSEKTQKSLQERHTKLSKPSNISSVGWDLHLVLKKTLPVHWDDQSIVVLGSVIIAPPYDAEDCKLLDPSKNPQLLTRVKDLVRKERERVAGSRGG